MSEHVHHPGCGCAAGMSRRGIFGLGLAGAITAAFPALAQYPNYEAMLVNCIDPRVTTSSFVYMAANGFKDHYSQFTIAGGPIGVVAPTFAAWQKTFWDNLAITVQLHSISRVVALTHRDCGAAFVAYGDALRTDKALETAKQTEALRAFRAEVGQRYPKLAVDTGIMALEGTVQVVT
jgi:hypothetical protein